MPPLTNANSHSHRPSPPALQKIVTSLITLKEIKLCDKKTAILWSVDGFKLHNKIADIFFDCMRLYVNWLDHMILSMWLDFFIVRRHIKRFEIIYTF